MRDILRELTDRYDQTANAYRELWAPILRTAALPLAHEMAGTGIARVLDIGTGVGALLPDLSSLFPEAVIVGVDRSRGMLAFAGRQFGRSLMDARQLGIRSSVMDRALLVFMLFHLEDPALALREAKRVLRPGGRVGTLTWAGELQSKATTYGSTVWTSTGLSPRILRLRLGTRPSIRQRKWRRCSAVPASSRLGAGRVNSLPISPRIA